MISLLIDIWLALVVFELLVILLLFLRGVFFFIELLLIKTARPKVGEESLVKSI